MIDHLDGDGVTLTSIMLKVTSHVDLKSFEIVVKKYSADEGWGHPS